MAAHGDGDAGRRPRRVRVPPAPAHADDGADGGVDRPDGGVAARGVPQPAAHVDDVRHGGPVRAARPQRGHAARASAAAVRRRRDLHVRRRDPDRRQPVPFPADLQPEVRRPVPAPAARGPAAARLRRRRRRVRRDARDAPAPVRRHLRRVGLRQDGDDEPAAAPAVGAQPAGAARRRSGTDDSRGGTRHGGESPPTPPTPSRCGAAVTVVVRNLRTKNCFYF